MKLKKILYTWKYTFRLKVNQSYHYWKWHVNAIFHFKPDFISLISNQNGGEYDVAVIGGGIVGMATAREMKVRHPNLSFIVLEKEKEICKNCVQIIVLLINWLMLPMPLSILIFHIWIFLNTLSSWNTWTMFISMSIASNIFMLIEHWVMYFHGISIFWRLYSCKLYGFSNNMVWILKGLLICKSWIYILKNKIFIQKHRNIPSTVIHFL